MEDTRWLKLITVGLVLAAFAVGYFLITGRFASNQTQKAQTNSSPRPVQQVEGQAVSPTPSSFSSGSGNVGVEVNAPSNTGGITTLPKTGFPIGLMGVFSASAVITGYFLRRYPR